MIIRSHSAQSTYLQIIRKMDTLEEKNPPPIQHDMAKRFKTKHILLAVTLHKSGCSATDARLAILQYFRRQRQPVSVRQIVEHLSGIGTGIDQATVYRTVTAFKAKKSSAK